LTGFGAVVAVLCCIICENAGALGLDQQADMSSKIDKIDADLTFIHKRIDMLDQPKARGSNPPH
jgi:hypothetical protein